MDTPPLTPPPLIKYPQPQKPPKKRPLFSIELFGNISSFQSFHFPQPKRALLNPEPAPLPLVVLTEVTKTLQCAAAGCCLEESLNAYMAVVRDIVQDKLDAKLVILREYFLPKYRMSKFRSKKLWLWPKNPVPFAVNPNKFAIIKLMDEIKFVCQCELIPLSPTPPLPPNSPTAFSKNPTEILSQQPTEEKTENTQKKSRLNQDKQRTDT
jgi:hypothetical protein